MGAIRKLTGFGGLGVDVFSLVLNLNVKPLKDKFIGDASVVCIDVFIGQ